MMVDRREAPGGHCQVLPSRVRLATQHYGRPGDMFSDASIMLAPDAIERIVAPFEDPKVGCVSGEDRIAGGGGEGLYGRYELFVRRQESALGDGVNVNLIEHVVGDVDTLAQLVGV